MASSTAGAASAIIVDESAVESVFAVSPMTPATGGNDSLAAAPSFECDVCSELRAITFFCTSGRSRWSRAIFERSKSPGRSRTVDVQLHDMVHTFLTGNMRVAPRRFEAQRLFVPIRFSRNVRFHRITLHIKSCNFYFVFFFKRTFQRGGSRGSLGGVLEGPAPRDRRGHNRSTRNSIAESLCRTSS